jgi:ABC-type nitrate/sulfonate/bicarbonate transport system permease component
MNNFLSRHIDAYAGPWPRVLAMVAIVTLLPQLIFIIGYGELSVKGAAGSFLVALFCVITALWLKQKYKTNGYHKE